MNISYRYFLVVAEELNITRAAQKLCISQQSLSNHIKRLENRYNAIFFQRFPTLKLTEDGVIFEEAVRKMLAIEENMKSTLLEGHETFHETVTIGMTWSRAAILIPDIIPDFHENFPNVSLDIHNDSSTNIEHRLLQGYIDLVVSTMNSDDSRLDKIHLIDERLYLVISDELLERHMGSEFPACKQAFRQGVDLLDFIDVPFTINTEDEILHQAIRSCFPENTMNLNVIFYSNSADIRSQLCAKGFAATILSELLLQYVFRQTGSGASASPLNIFPITNSYDHYSMNIYCNNFMHYSRSIRYLIDLLIDISNRYKYNNA